MEVYFSSGFTKAFKNIISKDKILKSRFEEKFRLFLQNPFHPAIKTHKLVGKLDDYWSFSVHFV